MKKKKLNPIIKSFLNIDSSEKADCIVTAESRTPYSRNWLKRPYISKQVRESVVF